MLFNPLVIVSVSSEGVTASIVEGDIPVANGVVHVVDQLLGFVYNNVREQIQVESTYVDFFLDCEIHKVKLNPKKSKKI